MTFFWGTSEVFPLVLRSAYGGTVVASFRSQGVQNRIVRKCCAGFGGELFNHNPIEAMNQNLLCSLGLIAVVLPAQATVVAHWTFETSKPFTDNVAIYPGFSPEIGAGTAFGTHASSGTDWSNPLGNGSPESFSANQWAVGDFFQFEVSLFGFEDAKLSWSQARSSTAPEFFSLSWSVDGSLFTPVLTNAIGTASWSGSSVHGGSIFTADLSAIGLLVNDSSVFFRLTALSAATSTSGGVRVDDFLVSASAITPVPELSGVGMAGILTATVALFQIRAWRRTDRGGR